MSRKKFYEEYSEIPYSLKSYQHNNILTRSIAMLRRNYVLKYLIESCSENDVFIDIGCADGYYVMMTDKLGMGYNIGIDIANNYIKRAKNVARSKNINPTYICADAEHLPFRAGIFTVSLLSEVLEHCPNPDIALNEFFRVSKNYMIFSYPTGESFIWVKIIKKIARILRLKTEEAGHINFYNFNEIFNKILYYQPTILDISGLGCLSWPLVMYPFSKIVILKNVFKLLNKYLFFIDSVLCQKHTPFSDTTIFWFKFNNKVNMIFQNRRS